nr:MAG TPA: hypothetical protein [Caudoviricetes sp.]
MLICKSICKQNIYKKEKYFYYNDKQEINCLVGL